MSKRVIWLLASLAAASACGDDSTGSDGGTDTGTVDTSVADSAPMDSGIADADAGDAAPPYVPVWTCLGSVTIPAPTAATATLTSTFTDFGSMGPAEGVVVDYCAWDDADCAAPIASGMTDAMGMIMLTAPTDPDPYWGFFTGTLAGAPRHEYFISTPISNDLSGAALILTEAAANILALAVGETQDWDANGVVGIAALDCDGRYSSGVRLTMTAGAGVPFYAEDGTFSTTATETDAGGAWGIINAVPGDFTVTAVRASDDTPIGTLDFRVKAGGVVAGYMNPTPDGAAYTP